MLAIVPRYYGGARSMSGGTATTCPTCTARGGRGRKPRPQPWVAQEVQRAALQVDLGDYYRAAAPRGPPSDNGDVMPQPPLRMRLALRTRARKLRRRIAGRS